ncbi:MAG: hypothetical protein IMX04_06990 [Candidatus Carbobacillus altaicus]|nr:hypothetical protein [Candidatus Carbobacillus altaicus]
MALARQFEITFFRVPFERLSKGSRERMLFALVFSECVPLWMGWGLASVRSVWLKKTV